MASSAPAAFSTARGRRLSKSCTTVVGQPSRSALVGTADRCADFDVPGLKLAMGYPLISDSAAKSLFLQQEIARTPRDLRHTRGLLEPLHPRYSNFRSHRPPG